MRGSLNAQVYLLVALFTSVLKRTKQGNVNTKCSKELMKKADMKACGMRRRHQTILYIDTWHVQTTATTYNTTTAGMTAVKVHDKMLDRMLFRYLFIQMFLIVWRHLNWLRAYHSFSCIGMHCYGRPLLRLRRIYTQHPTIASTRARQPATAPMIIPIGILELVLVGLPVNVAG